MRIKMLKGAGMGAKRKIEIRKVSRFVIWITLFLALVFVFLIIQGENVCHDRRHIIYGRIFC